MIVIMAVQLAREKQDVEYVVIVGLLGGLIAGVAWPVVFVLLPALILASLAYGVTKLARRADWSSASRVVAVGRMKFRGLFERAPRRHRPKPPSYRTPHCPNCGGSE
jgi:predicted membrane-bound spermidine synthase